MPMDEKPWMDMANAASLSYDDWMWENTGLAETIMEGRTHKPAKDVRDIMARWVKEESNPEMPIRVEKTPDGGLKLHWHDPDWAGLILKPEDFPLFETAAYRKLKAAILEYEVAHFEDPFAEYFKKNEA